MRGKHTAEKRNASADQASFDENEMFDRQPSPEDALALWEEIDVVLDGLPDRAAEIIAMRLEGTNRSEIAKELNLSRQTVHRILKLTQTRLEERFDQISSQNSLPSKEDGDTNQHC